MIDEMSNRLAAEQSPYLLQHAENPVDWYPWSDEAFARARAEGKPIFLSVGYSTCHWCHVMEHESFEDADTAKVLNEHFVCIKVDREERPDVDRVYMTFVQATTGAGGWPMSVWLTPALEPFYGGTYYPPVSQWGRPAFRDVLKEISRAWTEEPDRVRDSARDIVARLTAIAGQGEAASAPGETAIARTLERFQQTFDARRGGFGDQPKFPRPSELLFLFRAHARSGDPSAREMALTTLRAMALGGMRDHIGGGFHRYSVDGAWRVPHFEKMLYDQAQLVLAYLEAAQVSADPFYAQIAEDTLQYVRRDLSDPGGGFYSAEDADSVPPEHAGQPHPLKREGAFYVWGIDELRAALGDDSRLVELRYGALAEGNAPFDPQEEFGAGNLLYTARSIAEIAETVGRPPQEVAQALVKARHTLFNLRAGRPRPHLDDKVLTAWNGLMIAAFARAARVLEGIGLGTEDGHESAAAHLASATRAATFLRDTMWDPARRIVKRRYRRGDAAIDGYAEDYAALTFGLLELVQASGDARWLSWAIELQERLDALFWDEAAGGWFNTTGEDASVLLRMKDDHDGAEPAPGSLAVFNLLTLHQLTGEAAYRARADRALAAVGARLESMGRSMPMMAAALVTALTPGEQIVVAGQTDAAGRAGLVAAANRPYRPFASVVPLVSRDAQAALGKTMPWLAAMDELDGHAAAYICREFVCERPTTDPAMVETYGGARH
jgi:uncharacterized protein YyaL (SSP411 family)